MTGSGGPVPRSWSRPQRQRAVTRRLCTGRRAAERCLFAGVDIDAWPDYAKRQTGLDRAVPPGTRREQRSGCRSVSPLQVWRLSHADGLSSAIHAALQDGDFPRDVPAGGPPQGSTAVHPRRRSSPASCSDDNSSNSWSWVDLRHAGGAAGAFPPDSASWSCVMKPAASSRENLPPAWRCVNPIGPLASRKSECPASLRRPRSSRTWVAEAGGPDC